MELAVLKISNSIISYSSIVCVCVLLNNLKIRYREFPESPVVRTPRFHCQRYRFNPSLGREDPTSLVVWRNKKPTNHHQQQKTHGFESLTFNYKLDNCSLCVSGICSVQTVSCNVKLIVQSQG